MIKLLHLKDTTVIQEFTLADGVTHIGRGPGNRIRIDDLSISLVHAEITVRPNKYLSTLKDVILRDLHSTNGTYINGTRIDYGNLRDGDRIRIGAHQFKLERDGEKPMETTRIYLPEVEDR